MRREELIAALEAATEPSRELDKAIHGFAGFCLHPRIEYSGAQSDTGFTCTTCGANSWGSTGARGERLHYAPPNYTASIDAALTLTPGERGFVLMGCAAKVGREIAKGATPAIALCIAVLKARAA